MTTETPTTTDTDDQPTDRAAEEEAADHLGDDRLVRRPGAEDHPGSVRARPGHARRGAPGDRRAVGGPGQVHRHAHLPRGPPGPVLPDGHGRAGHARRRRRTGRGRAGALRVDLLGVRDPPRLRLPLPRHRRAQPERQRRRRAARPDHRLRAQPPGHRGPRDPARLPEPDHRRPLRLGRHRAGRPAARRPQRADLPAAAPRRRCPRCSTSTATASSSARPPSCAPAATSSSSRRA